MKVLVTGGLGFIGSHTVVALLEHGYDVVVIDNLYNSKEVVKDRIKEITHKDFKTVIADVQNADELEKIFKEEKIDAIIHFAGYKAVGESVSKPVEYYENNLDSTFALLKMMKKYGTKNFVFSSSATVYGEPKRVPMYETDPVTEATSPYGETKVMIERILKETKLKRLRLSSIEINEIDDRLLNLIKDNNKICPHLHIPLQSGCDKILSLMGRKYKKDDYINVIAKARKLIPNVTIGSDIIAGFPSETDDDFNETLNTLKKAGTEFYHAFPYSERKGTKAENMENKVDVKIREERAAKLREQGHISLMNLYKNSIGKTYTVLTEKGNKGHTENYMLVHYDKNTEPNQFVKVVLTEINNGKLYGKVI